MIHWDDSLKVNVAVIDLQHKKLVRTVNELEDTIRAGTSNGVIGGTVHLLAGYFRLHFAAEERYFAKFNYPLAEQHIHEHRNFTVKVDEFEDKCHRERHSLSLDSMAFLSEWLGSHIRGADRKYTDCFNANGLM